MSKSNAYGIGIDISKYSLEVANENVQNYKMDKRCKLLEGSFDNFATLLKSINEETPVDLIISNPPYLTRESSKSYNNKMLNCEPSLALFSESGYDAYQMIYDECVRNTHLFHRNSLFIFEVSSKVIRGVTNMFSGAFDVVDVVKDEQGLERCLVFKLKI